MDRHDPPPHRIYRRPTSHDARIEEAAREGSDLVLISIAAAKFNVNPRLIAKWVKDGLIHAYALPGSWRRVSLREIERFLRDQLAPAPRSAAILHIERRLAERREYERRKREREQGAPPREPTTR